MSVYEPDGTLIEPKPVEELEYVCEIGGEFDKTSVTLSVSSRNLDRHLVTQLLEVNPAKAWNLNEPHPLGKKGCRLGQMVSQH